MKPLAGGDDAMTFRLVTRLFLRRLIDNDLISPHADRHQSLAVVLGFVVSLAVFVTFFLSTPYLMAFIQLPGTAALSALSDRFLFIAASIAMSALAALMVWEALALEARDAAILGPLPIAARTITHAKLAAAMVFGAVLTVALNAVPSVLYPAFLTVNIRGIAGATILRLIAAHATTVIMAGLFGFFGILAIRGLLRLLLGDQAFRRASSGVQSVLVVIMVTALLLAPTVRARDVRHWVGDAVVPPWPVGPVLWYLGMNETLAGYGVADTPIELPPRMPPIASLNRDNQAARAAYRPLLPPFAAQARRAWVSLPLVTALALATFLWTNRRLPDRSEGVPAPSRLRTIVRRMAERYTHKDPEAQAGFFFALQTLTRSAPHRTIIAIALAGGLTHALMVLAQSDGRSLEIQSTPVGVLGIAILFLLVVVAGVAYAVAVPAELAANWTIQMAWLGDERRYLAGVKRAGLLLVAVLLVLSLPLHVALLGIAVAIVHSLLGFLLAVAALDALLLPYQKLPFACSYVPLQNPKLVWPTGVVSLLLVTYGCATAERWALHTATRTIALGVVLGALVLLVKAADRARRRERRPIRFDDRPAGATQRLGLFDHVAIHD
jgi:hypothetical protein